LIWFPLKIHGKRGFLTEKNPIKSTLNLICVAILYKVYLHK